MAFLALGGCTLLVYSNSFYNSYHYDDYFMIGNNPHIRSLKNAPRFFLDDSTSHLPVQLYGRSYRPITLLSWALNHAVSGEKVWSYHIGNFVLHGLCAGMILILFEALARHSVLVQDSGKTELIPLADQGCRLPGLGLFAALLFALHPIHSETVNYLGTRGDLLATLFMLLSLVFFIRSGCPKDRRPPDWSGFPRPFLWALSLFFFAAALLSKEFGIVLVAGVLLYDFCFRPPLRWKETVRRFLFFHLPFWVLAIGYLLLRQNLLGVILDTRKVRPMGTNLATQSVVFVQYIQKILFPVNLSVNYESKVYDVAPFLSSETSPEGLQKMVNAVAGLGRALYGIGVQKFSEFWPVVLSSGVFLALLILIYRLLRRHREIAFGLLYFLATLAPTSLIPLNIVRNDHRLYVAMAGVVLVAAFALGKVRHHLLGVKLSLGRSSFEARKGLGQPRVAEPILSGMLLGAAYLVLLYLAWSVGWHLAEKGPPSNPAWPRFLGLGMVLSAFVFSLLFSRDAPGRPSFLAIFWGTVLIGSIPSFSILFEEASASLALIPGVCVWITLFLHFPARKLAARMVGQGVGEEQAGPGEEKKLPLDLLGIGAGYGLLLLFSSLTFARNFVWFDEYLLWKDAIAKAPQVARVNLNFGFGQELRGYHQQALAAYNKSLSLQPNYDTGHIKLGYLYKQLGDFEQAMEHFQKVQLGLRYTDCQTELGNLHWERGEYEKAVEVWRGVLKLDPYHGRAKELLKERGHQIVSRPGDSRPKRLQLLPLSWKIPNLYVQGFRVGVVSEKEFQGKDPVVLGMDDRIWLEIQLRKGRGHKVQFLWFAPDGNLFSALPRQVGKNVVILHTTLDLLAHSAGRWQLHMEIDGKVVWETTWSIEQ